MRPARGWFLGAVVLAGTLGACGTSGPARQPIFIDGRAVAAVGDTLLAFTRAGLPAVLLQHRASGTVDTLGRGALHSPLHIQFAGDRWYVSDVEDGRPSLAVFAADGRLERRIDLARVGAVPHQFAVLPDNRIVVETPEGRLIALAGDSGTRFVDARGGPKTGLVAAASGGVVQALPDKHLTLYNQFGNIRWRIDWPWLETAFVTDLTVDANGRIHIIAGIPAENNFVVFGLAATTGEVVRWSTPGPHASFTVDFLGEIRPDTAQRRDGNGVSGEGEGVPLTPHP
ncbi:MAG TPA: hypothetical protein VJL31_16420 [Gemmatimonadales bacterium]|nr:hypothetical protein [Gemmatimonadales bacterium]